MNYFDCLDSPIISDNIFDHIDQSKSKNGRTQLMSYLQGSSIIKEKLINSIRNKDKDDLDNTNLMYLCASNERYTTKTDINMFKDEKGNQNKFGMTALMYLCNHSKISTTAIQALNNEINKKDFNSYTALMHYLRLNHPCNCVINMLKQEIGNVDYMGRTALMHFFETEKDSFELKTIKTFYDLMRNEIGKKCFLGRTALMRYMYRKKIQISFINMLKDEICMQDFNGNTALLLYLTYNQTPSIKVVRCLNREYEIPNNFGLTPLILIKIKLENLKDNGQSSIVYKGYLNRIKHELSNK